SGVGVAPLIGHGRHFEFFWCRLAALRDSRTTFAIQKQREESSRWRKAFLLDSLYNRGWASRLTAARTPSPGRSGACSPESLAAWSGGQWDISWHMSIGRDTFWTPAHILIQLTGVLVGMACGYMILTATFGGDTAIQSRSVKIWGFRGPLGAFIATWGCMAMLTSAPFDNWWHNAYGLDVKIVIPPHMVLAWGMIGIQIGAMLMALSAQNRASANDQPLYSMIHAYAAAILVTMIATVIQEYASVGNQMHGSLFYKVTAWSIPLFLIGLSRA